jgi:hypothetical protein
MGHVIEIVPDHCFVKHGRIDHVREFVESTSAIEPPSVAKSSVA